MRALLWIVPILAVIVIAVFATGVLDPDEPNPGGSGDDVWRGDGGEGTGSPPPRHHVPPAEEYGMTEEEILAIPRIAVLPEGRPFPPPFPGCRRRPGSSDHVLRLEGSGPVRAKDVLDALTKIMYVRVRSQRDLPRLEEFERDDAWRDNPPRVDEVLASFADVGFDVQDHGHVVTLMHPESQILDRAEPR